MQNPIRSTQMKENNKNINEILSKFVTEQANSIFKKKEKEKEIMSENNNCSC